MASQMTVGTKLIVAFGSVLVPMLILAGSSLWSVRKLANTLDTEINQTAKKVELTAEIDALSYKMRTAQRGVVMYSMLKQSGEAEKNKRVFQSSAEGMERAIEAIRPLVYKPEGKQALARIQLELKGWLPRFQSVLEYTSQGRFNGELSNLLLETGASNERLGEAAGVLMKIQLGIEREAAASAAATEKTSLWMVFVPIAICLAAAVGVVLIIRQINGSLRDIAAEMRDGAAQVTSAAAELAASSQSLAQGSSEQAASLEETSAAAEQISSMTRRNADNSRSAALTMDEAAARIGTANENLSEMVVSMGQISACSNKIASIIKIIDEIAFQTNILALNAAVEAARAGEAGMGFAVVADEVRSLAKRCADAARDTTSLIEESISTSDDGRLKVEQVTSAVHGITESANRVKTLIQEMKCGSEEQSRGIEEVAKAVAQMESITRTTATSADEGAAASEQLTAQAETLRGLVVRLNEMVGAG